MTMFDIKWKLAFQMIYICLPNTSFLVFLKSVTKEYICGGGIHKSNSNAITFLLIQSFSCGDHRMQYKGSLICCPELATPNFVAYKWRKERKEDGRDFIWMSLMFGKTVRERGFFSGPWVAILAPILGFFPGQKMNCLPQHVYSTIYKVKWQNTVISIPFMKNKLKKRSLS